jgi:hypothetical protein
LRFAQKLVARQAGVARSTVRVEDSQIHRPAGWRVPVPCDSGLSELADHVTAEPDPRPTAQLQLQPGRLLHGRGYRIGQSGRLEDDQLDFRSPGDGRKPVYPIAQFCRRTRLVRRAGGQIQQQQVHGPVLEEHRGHGQGLCQRIRRQHDEPLQPDASRYGFNRIQASGQVQIRGDSAGGLGLRDRLESQSGLAAGAVSLKGYSCRPWQPSEAENRIQGPKTGGDGSIVRSAKQPAERSAKRLADGRAK